MYFTVIFSTLGDMTKYLIVLKSCCLDQRVFSIPYGLTLPSNMANIGKYLLGNKFLGKHAQELIHY